MSVIGLTWLIFWFWFSGFLALIVIIIIIGLILKAMLGRKVDKLKQQFGGEDDGYTA